MIKYATFTFLGFVMMMAYNAFLIQRDDKMFKAYYKQSADVEYCKVHADCKVK